MFSELIANHADRRPRNSRPITTIGAAKHSAHDPVALNFKHDSNFSSSLKTLDDSEALASYELAAFISVNSIVVSLAPCLVACDSAFDLSICHPNPVLSPITTTHIAQDHFTIDKLQA